MFLTLLLAAVLLANTVHADPLPPVESAKVAGEKAMEEKKDAKKGNWEKHSEEVAGLVVTRRTLMVGGEQLAYRVTTGTLPVQNNVAETEARVFFVAYTLDTPSPGTKRPLLFIFNGGPGAASVWLHLGAAGPRRVQMLSDGRMPPPPYLLADNESTWLEQSDLVFVDPVNTGYSRAVKPELAKKFSNVQGDIDLVGRFIMLYLGRYDRWDSPLFLVGESYGAFRAAGLSEYLLDHGIALNGVILISSVLNMQTIRFDQGNDLPYPLFLPSYSATAWYHRMLGPKYQVDLDKTLALVEAWAETDYVTALAMGDRLSPEKRREIAEKLAEFTGLSSEYIDRRNLRVDNRSFARELLRDRRELVGVMDSRLTAADPNPAARHGFDPTLAAIRPPYTSAFNQYVRSELGFRSDLEYIVLEGSVENWDWETKNAYADTSDNLRYSLAKNPYMKVFVASGLFDLATPHATTAYTLNHLGLTPALRGNITTRNYRAGHMMYLDTTSLAELKRDVTTFICSSLAAKGAECP